MPELAGAAPLILHGLSGWFAVHMDQQRILLGAIELRGQHAPAVDFDTVAYRNPEELRSGHLQGGQLLADLLVVGQHSHGFVIGQRNELGLRRHGERRHRVESPAAVGRSHVLVGTRDVGGREAFEAAAAERAAVEVALGGVVRGGREVEFIAALAHPHQFGDIEGPAGGRLEFAVLQAGPVQMLPAIPLAPEEEPSAVAVPGQVVVRFDPGLVGVDQQLLHVAG